LHSSLGLQLLVFDGDIIVLSIHSVNHEGIPFVYESMEVDTDIHEL